MTILCATRPFIWMVRGIIFDGAVITIAFTLFGCTTMETADRVWYKEGGTVEERDRLLGAAQVQAQQAHAVATPGSPDTLEAHHQSETQSVMATMSAAGWSLVPRAQAGRIRNAP